MSRTFRFAVPFVAVVAFAQPDLRHARELYQSTRYELAIQALKEATDRDSLLLAGQSWFMLGEFKNATEILERAVSANPSSSNLHLWLGKAYGRRAETSSPFLAPKYASKARQHFEKAVELDPTSVIAMNDLFEYYMQAPGFLGGGKEKAEALAQRIARLDRAEGHYATARLAEDRKEFSAAENHLRHAWEAAPSQVGRLVDLARFLAKQGRHQESEAEFNRAQKLEPNNPKILFERASTYIQTKRNLVQAKLLLKQYLEAPLTPEDPSRQEAQKLLKSARLQTE
ncbi:MAG TPA: tetratricopeptide repeat protein [Bryobacteraceae bacterium]|nr:tetratricopeptide repeat protein [Bryobacteraceae bacterium]